jgi:transcription elongation factor Elf1
MSQSQRTVQIVSPMARPSCSKCGRVMMNTRTVPDIAGYDLRTFECAMCGHDETVLMAI